MILKGGLWIDGDRLFSAYNTRTVEACNERVDHAGALSPTYVL